MRGRLRRGLRFSQQLSGRLGGWRCTVQQEKHSRVRLWGVIR